MADVTLRIEDKPALAAYFEDIATDLKIRADQVVQTFELLATGSTLPFIARYRKEKTGNLNEEVLSNLQDRLMEASDLQARKKSILNRLRTMGKLTESLEKLIAGVKSKTVLEDIYAPYKFKRKTRAAAAEEKGLKPLAEKLKNPENLVLTPEELAGEFVSEEKKVTSSQEALQGAMDILAEEVSENHVWKQTIREREYQSARLVSRVVEKFKDKKSKFETYYNFTESIATIPSFRVLAIRRGEKEGYLKFSLQMSDEENVKFLKNKVLPRAKNLYEKEMGEMVEDAYRRLIRPSIESEINHQMKAAADGEAYKVFKKNLRDVLMAPPALGKVVLGVDPGFRSGTKLAVVDATGKFLQEKTIYPTPPQQEVEASKTIFQAMVESFKVEIIAIGNGTASREVDEFVTQCLNGMESPPLKVMVSEAGASVYSASPLARQEFPKLDVTIRGAISIARRVQDPLAELVKIEPKSLGIGQYQHDVNQKELKEKLEQVVQSSVNAVGVNINTASEALLGFVSGVNKALAKNLVAHREKTGPFRSRASLVKVSQFGPKVFEQATGFLRIPDAENPLDGTAVHPERYELVRKICDSEGLSLEDLIGHPDKVKQIDFAKFQNGDVGLPTLMDIKAELEKPGRDPRKKFTVAHFNSQVKTPGDLKEGMWLEGVVSNVTDFGVFVDVGVHHDGLVHVSEMERRYKNSEEIPFSSGEVVKVRVLSVDKDTNRISFSMREGRAKKRPPKPRRRHATLNQLKTKFSGNPEEKRNNVKLKFSVKSIMKSGR